jgi:hypothetical protein
MRKKKTTDLVPTKDEIREILSQVFEAQAEQHFRNIQDLPVVLLQAWTGQVVLNAFNSVKNQYDKSANELIAETKKAIRRLKNSIDNR